MSDSIGVNLFGDSEKAIPVPPLGIDPPQAHLLAVWNAARGSRLFPVRSQLQPRALTSILPRLLICERLGPAHYFIRLAGGMCHELLGRELTGKNWADISDPAHWPARAEKFDSFLDHPCGWQTTTPITRSWGEGMDLTTLSLPLARDGETRASLFVSVITMPKPRPVTDPFHTENPILIAKSTKSLPVDIGAGVPTAR